MTHRFVSRVHTCVLLALAVAAPGTCWAGITYGADNIVAAANGGKLISATSQADNAEWAARNLIDGLHVTYRQEEGRTVVDVPVGPGGVRAMGWSSRDTRPQDIIFAFRDERPRLIGKVVIDPVTADPPWTNRWVKDVQIWVSETVANGPYKLVDTFLVANRPLQQTFQFAAPAEARYIKLRLESNHGSPKCLSMGEFEVYEAIVTESELDALVENAEAFLESLLSYAEARNFAISEAGTAEENNVAASANGGQIVSATSQRDEEWRAANLIDGQVWDTEKTADEQEGVSYGWSSDRAAFPQEVVVAIASQEPDAPPKLVDRIALDCATADGFLSGRWAQHFEVHAALTTDGPWVRTGRFRLANRPGTQTFDFRPIEAKLVRLVITSNHGSDKYVELGEVRVYQTRPVSDLIIQLASRWQGLVEDLRRYRDEQRAAREPEVGETPAAAGGP